ncbi:MAG: Cna B-type domain-containing protein, partial [Clostridia bacterium]
EGNQTVKGIKLTDSLAGISAITPNPANFTLAPKGSATFTYDYVVTEEDVAAGEVKNVATARAAAAEGQDVSATASATATIDRTFGYTIEYAYAGTVDATATVNATAQYGDVIANVLDAVSVGDARHPGKPQAGYAFEKVTIPAGGTIKTQGNLIRVDYLRLYQTVAGTKTWVDENNAYGTRPTSVTVELLDAGGNVVGTTTATAEAGWSYSFGGLDYFGSYTVREVAVPNYAGTVSGSNLTNTLSGGVTSVSGEKRWANDTAAARPASVTIALYADGVATGQTLEATAANNWAYTFENVPLYAGGKQILYTVQEATVPAGYASSASGMNLTNTANDYTLTVRYWYDAVDGERAAADYVGTHAYGSYYSVTSPDVRTGWAPDKATVTGNMPASDVVADVIYTEQNYALTVNYTYAETGAEAAPTYREKALKAGEKYNVTSPEIPDYKNTKPVVKGTMPAHNVKVTVTYLADGTATVEITPYGVPLGLGAISANVGDCVE